MQEWRAKVLDGCKLEVDAQAFLYDMTPKITAKIEGLER